MANHFTVILSIDASKEAEGAVQYYLENIHRSQNRVMVLHVTELPDVDHGKVLPETLDKVWTKEETKAEELKTSFEKVLRAKGVENVESRLARGMKAGEGIIKVADEEKASMIVVGSRGVGVIRRTLIGTVSDYVVHNASCPVVVCCYPDEKKN